MSVATPLTRKHIYFRQPKMSPDIAIGNRWETTLPLFETTALKVEYVKKELKIDLLQIQEFGIQTEPQCCFWLCKLELTFLIVVYIYMTHLKR